MTTAASHSYFRASVVLEDEYEDPMSTLKSTVQFNENFYAATRCRCQMRCKKSNLGKVDKAA